MARLFVAVWPPASVVAAVAAAVPPRPRPGIRWIPAGNWHVTLRFLGQADPDEVAGALDALEADRARAVVGPAVTTLGRSAVVVPVQGLDELALAVQRVTAHLGQPAEDRRFTGHLTLARRTGRARAPVGIPVEAHVDVEEVVLVRSETRPSGAEYRVVRSWPLPTAGVGRRDLPRSPGGSGQ